MVKLPPAEFFMRAIQRVPWRDPKYPRYFHLGVRLELLRQPFARYYGGEYDLTADLDILIRRNVVVAAHVTWEGETDARHVAKAQRLYSFPDPLVPEDNPILYLPTAVPKVLRTRLSRPEEILAKILEPTLVVANA